MPGGRGAEGAVTPRTGVGVQPPRVSASGRQERSLNPTVIYGQVNPFSTLRPRRPRGLAAACGLYNLGESIASDYKRKPHPYPRYPNQNYR